MQCNVRYCSVAQCGASVLVVLIVVSALRSIVKFRDMLYCSVA